MPSLRYLLKLFVFERDSYFWKKLTLTQKFLAMRLDLSENIICSIAIVADDTSLYSNYDQTSDLWKQLELTFQFELDKKRH